MATIKAVIFDMDGVLIDAKEWHYEAMNQALARFGFTITRAEHLERYDGLPTKRKLELLSEHKGFPRELHAAASALKQELTMQIVETHCSPTFQHVRALHCLKRAGFAVGLASNSVRQSVSRMMDLAGLSPYLDFQLSNEDVARPKPHPEIYLKAAQLAKALPDQCVVVEDNHHGIEAATAAGTHVLAVRGTAEVTYEHIARFMTDISDVAPPAACRAA
jgi:HAD superfamily hydrolase (TIGR01509 family)